VSPEPRRRRFAHGRHAERIGRAPDAGMTMVELVVAIVVVAISLTGAFALVDSTTRRSADPMLERQATAIAQAYLEEALQKAYLDPNDGKVCPAAEAQRSLFDNVCDYQGLADVGARDQTGTTVPGLEAYRIALSIDTNARLGALVGSGAVLRIDVTVTDPRGRPLRLSAYRTKT
jgi:MSHA pilin protein MshD